ncbi:MAG: DNA (cytosine-5-)-methyltransferase [Bacteroidales bacterium]
MKKYREIKTFLIESLRDSFPKIERNEVEAMVTHWLQSQNEEIPFFTTTMRKHCIALLQHKQTRTLRSKGVRELSEPYQVQIPIDWGDTPFPPVKYPEFKFIDLFAGIGGFRIAFQNLGGKCVFSCEWDKYSQKTYEKNFGECPYGDVRQFTDPLKISDAKLDRLIPDHNILAAGFPCQPFSIAGVSKKNSLGRKHGFEDPTQGTLFFDIKRILDIKRPAAFFLENVKNLLTHDGKRTFAIIEDTLDGLGYVWDKSIIDAAKWVPQHRERIFIVGYNPKKVSNIKKEDIIFPKVPDASYKYPNLSNIIKDGIDEKYTLGPGTWDTLERHKKHHKNAGNGFGYGLITKEMLKKSTTVTRTISARYHKDGAEILIEQLGKRPRRLTVREAMQLMGYNPDKFIFPVSDTQAYRQIGNSVVVPAVSDTAQEIVKILGKKY